MDILDITSKELPWFADIANYLVSGLLPYHLQISGQVEVSNREIKCLLQEKIGH